MRSALISFARSLSLTGDGAGGFPSAFALNGPACARINMLDRFDLSDEKLRDALDSSPWSRFVKHRRSQRLPSAKKAGHIKSMPVRLRLQIPLLDEPRPLSASLSVRSAKADGKPPAPSPVSDRLRATKMIEADLMSRHVPLLRWTLTPIPKRQALD